jgi:hypothetical protein
MKSADRIVFSTEARGLQAIDKAAQEERKRTDAERAQTMAVALAQPHRQGSTDPRLSEPLGRFCAAHRLKNECWRAGNQHAEVLRQAKAARGFKVPDLIGAGGNSDLTPQQIEAMREAAVIRERDAIAVLVTVMPRAPRAVERFVYDQLEPSIYDHDLLKHCLWKLAVHYGYIDLGVNRDKAI